MFKKTMYTVSIALLVLVSASVAHEPDPFLDRVHSSGRTEFELEKLWTGVQFGSGGGNVSTVLESVEYMSMVTGAGQQNIEFGSGDGSIWNSIPARASANVFNYSVSDQFISTTNAIPSSLSPGAYSGLSVGSFVYTIEAENITTIDLKMGGGQIASTTIRGRAQGEAQVMSSFALYDEQDPLFPVLLDSDTRSLSAQLNRPGTIIRRWYGDFNVGYEFAQPFSGTLVLTGGFSNFSTGTVPYAAAPEPTLIISLGASLIGLFALRKKREEC
ncbi:PEP-CTERM sorting domain-containing protein [Chitinispirillales bacterium ANBcel5]|uniref:PEP-CTERM sorting domain-containing protein n=1 Tax=Cellulosispirillum alkaliphilum TaxID=3039283 RepID=UPI002A5222A0|nr:PEP-CTERM sorting domain-containing protein [Chitinispirillales bacterium ANBcel5]